MGQIKEKSKKIWKRSKNWPSVKAQHKISRILRVKFITLNAYIRNQEWTEISDLRWFKDFENKHEKQII